jgi:A/G-specific adenine glycosylase
VKVAELPIKEKKTKVRTRYFNYIVFHYKKEIIIHKRTGKDIWTNLYDFPLIETTTDKNEKEFLASKEWKKLIGNTKYIVKSVSKQHKHILSHQKIMARFWEINCNQSMVKLNDQNCVTIKKTEIGKYAVPRLIDNYLIGQDKD